MLSLADIHVSYGRINAVRGVTLEIGDGEIVTIVGANGSGKTTIINTISGILRPRKGTISFLGQEITRTAAHHIARMGLVQIPEGREILTTLSVQENLEIAANCLREKKGIQSDLEGVYTRFPILKERKKQPTGTLSGGEQQMLAIARGLMAQPKLLMMDEPSLGLAPLVVAHIFAIIGGLKKERITILLVEQNAKKALMAADRGYVLEIGKIVMADTARNLLQNAGVQEAYLGSGS